MFVSILMEICLSSLIFHKSGSDLILFVKQNNRKTWSASIELDNNNDVLIDLQSVSMVSMVPHIRIDLTDCISVVI